MPERLDDFLLHRKPTPERPLQGHTVLVVEDSRFASEAMRLLCLRSGARVRRADTLQNAARHLATYRPTVLIVDLGLPDGSGLTLIRDLAQASERIPVILATSGDDAAQDTAIAAGADGFLGKPLSRLDQFQHAILDRLPAGAHPMGPRALNSDHVSPDTLALQDDLALVAREIGKNKGEGASAYLAQFLESIARSAGDVQLEEAAQALGRARRAGAETATAVRRVSGLVAARLKHRAVV